MSVQLPTRAKNLTGQRYGSLTAVEPVKLSLRGSMIWGWLCDCGNRYEGTGTQIKAVAKAATNPKVPSCGCIKAQRAVETNTTHGYSRHPLNAIWQAMKQRCCNPNHKEYRNYGAKGVTLCSDWLETPENFVNWALANGWQKGMHIDKDAYSDALGILREYSPKTCRIITAAVNAAYSASRQNYKNNSRIKLTPSDIGEIWVLYTSGEYTQRELGKMYGVSQAAIHRALRN